ncbi:hypothetical protein EJB05_08578, partial [Eragrostis curvula]
MFICFLLTHGFFPSGFPSSHILHQIFEGPRLCAGGAVAASWRWRRGFLLRRRSRALLRSALKMLEPVGVRVVFLCGEQRPVAVLEAVREAMVCCSSRGGDLLGRRRHGGEISRAKPSSSGMAEPHRRAPTPQALCEIPPALFLDRVRLGSSRCPSIPPVAYLDGLVRHPGDDLELSTPITSSGAATTTASSRNNTTSPGTSSYCHLDAHASGASISYLTPNFLYYKLDASSMIGLHPMVAAACLVVRSAPLEEGACSGTSLILLLCHQLLHPRKFRAVLLLLLQLSASCRSDGKALVIILVRSYNLLHFSPLLVRGFRVSQSQLLSCRSSMAEWETNKGQFRGSSKLSRGAFMPGLPPEKMGIGRKRGGLRLQVGRGQAMVAIHCRSSLTHFPMAHLKPIIDENSAQHTTSKNLHLQQKSHPQSQIFFSGEGTAARLRRGHLLPLAMAAAALLLLALLVLLPATPPGAPASLLRVKSRFALRAAPPA